MAFAGGSGAVVGGELPRMRTKASDKAAVLGEVFSGEVVGATAVAPPGLDDGRPAPAAERVCPSWHISPRDFNDPSVFWKSVASLHNGSPEFLLSPELL